MVPKWPLPAIYLALVFSQLTESDKYSVTEIFIMVLYKRMNDEPFNQFLMKNIH